MAREKERDALIVASCKGYNADALRRTKQQVDWLASLGLCSGRIVPSAAPGAPLLGALKRFLLIVNVESCIRRLFLVGGMGVPHRDTTADQILSGQKSEQFGLLETATPLSLSDGVVGAGIHQNLARQQLVLGFLLCVGIIMESDR